MASRESGAISGWAGLGWAGLGWAGLGWRALSLSSSLEQHDEIIGHYLNTKL